ncbi:integrin alpha-X-like [Clavelina lepadiformis]|uniref:integrin alpha-X-like n=1 Tax=Clavelina lepadiformis TaxID=159417 RepID=UPI004041C5DF
MMIYLTAALAYLVALTPASNSYNIDDGGGGFKVMGERASSFFGYNLRISKEGDDFRLLVGAPKSTKSSNPQSVNTSSPLAEGSIESCGLQNFIESSVNCISVAPPTASPGDSYGLSLDVATDSTLHVCSPIKMQSCPPVAYSPGYCFRRSEETRNWTEGPQTEKTDCSLVSLDIVILLDGSLSVGRVNFELVKQWTINVSRSFDIADGSTEIGVIQYSHHYSQQDLNEQDYIVTEISLGQYRSQSQFEDAVEMIRLHSFTTYTAHALNKSVYDFQSSTRYSDPRTAKVMILLTDGRSSDNEFLPYSANYLRSLGIRTFAIGVGRAVRDELQIIANGDGTDERVFYVTNFEDLSKIISALRTEILSFALEGVREGEGAMTSVHHLQFGEKGFSLSSGLVKITRFLSCFVNYLIYFFVRLFVCLCVCMLGFVCICVRVCVHW